MNFNVIEIQENLIAQNVMSKRSVISKNDRASCEKYISNITDRFAHKDYEGSHDMWWACNDGEPVRWFYYIEN